MRRLFGFILLAVCCLQAQNTSSTVKAIVLDPQGGSVAGAAAVLTGDATGLTLNAISNGQGIVTFPSVLAGDYTLTVEVPGFEKYIRTGIHLTNGEIRDLGSLIMTVGAVNQSVSVSDSITPLQTASGERSGTVSGKQLNQLALKGRDFFALASLLPGVVDTNTTGRDATSPNSLFQPEHQRRPRRSEKLHRRRRQRAGHRRRQYGSLRAQHGLHRRSQNPLRELSG